MTEYLDPADVELLIDRLDWHLRDRGLLLSALAAPMPVFGEEVHPTLPEKAAALLSAINRDHPLLDGNKRLSWLVAAAFSELNGFDLAAPQVEIDRFVRSVAAGIGRADAAAWIAEHLSPLT